MAPTVDELVGLLAVSWQAWEERPSHADRARAKQSALTALAGELGISWVELNERVCSQLRCSDWVNSERVVSARDAVFRAVAAWL